MPLSLPATRDFGQVDRDTRTQSFPVIEYDQKDVMIFLACFPYSNADNIFAQYLHQGYQYHLLALLTGVLTQWSLEKWATRGDNSGKNIILIRGQGSQHAMLILGEGKGFDLEDLAGGAMDASNATSYTTRAIIIVLSIFWMLLLITASGIKNHTWFLLAVGAVGMRQNIFVSGWKRHPAAFGIELEYVTGFANVKVMETLYATERAYKGAGDSMLPIFFPGKLRDNEIQAWSELRVK